MSMKRTSPKTSKPRGSAQGRVTIRAAGAKTPKVVSPTLPDAKPASNRVERAAERRAAIIEAALDEFIARGFTATRLDDVAQPAGVAQGTIYLHFQNKNLARFPQILVAPALVAVIWQSLFGKHAPLDAIEMFGTHLDLIFGERRTT